MIFVVELIAKVRGQVRPLNCTCTFFVLSLTLFFYGITGLKKFFCFALNHCKAENLNFWSGFVCIVSGLRIF